MPDGDAINRVEDIYERLERSARIQPVGDEAMNVTSKDGLVQARDLVNWAIQQGDVTASGLARRTNIKPSVISAFRNDKWKGSAGTLLTVASNLARGVNQLLLQREAERTEVGGFVKKSVACAIYDIVHYVLKRRWIGVFVIPAGSGKTITLRQIHEETPGSVLLTVTHTRSSAKAFLQTWARAVGLDEIGPAQQIQDSIIGCLIRSDRLVMIDECHKLGTNCLDIVREIYDETKIPIVMAGTPSFYRTLTARRVGTVSSELMDQLYSRVGLFRDMTERVNSDTANDKALFTREDIRKVFARGRIRLSRDAADLLFKLANHPASGGLRTCRDLVQMVADLHAGEEITAKLLRAAYAMKLGDRESGFRIDQAFGRATSEPAPVAATA